MVKSKYYNAISNCMPMNLSCPECKSNAITKNGTFRNKQRYICKKCKKTFTEDKTRGFPPTSVPFEFIALVLYRSEGGANAMKLKMINYFLDKFDFKKKKITRITLYDWKKKYGKIYEDLVTLREANRFFQDHIYKAFPTDKEEERSPPEDEVEYYKRGHVKNLMILRERFGEKECKKMLKEEPDEFNDYLTGVQANKYMKIKLSSI